MKKYLPILLIVCFALFFCSAGEEGVMAAGPAELIPTQFTEIGYAAVLELAKEEDKHVLIDFFSPT